MITTEDLIDFVLAEQRESQKQQRMQQLLSPDALVELGRGLGELYLHESKKGQLCFECPENESRIRPGIQVLLTSSCGVNLNAEVVAIEAAGQLLHLACGRISEDLPQGPWFAIEVERDFTPLLLQSIRKLQPGAPGWPFYKALSIPGEQLPARPVKQLDAKIGLRRQVLNELAEPSSATTSESASSSPSVPDISGNSIIDASQLAAIERCLGEPQLFGVQGPPGTGKTKVLAIVAETLARLGKRVLIVAPTHQAVNNALAVVRRGFPKRKLIKVGSALRRESLPDDVECLLLKEAVRHVGGGTNSEAIVGMTFLSAIQRLAVQSSGLAPHVVLIDEAGQLPLAQGLCAGLFGAGSVLLFGDDRQMPPVFTSELGQSPLAVSLFTQLRRLQPEHVCLLSTSYRMNREICDFISRSFYADIGTLVPGPANADRCFTEAFTAGAGGIAADCQTDEVTSKVLTGSSSFYWIQTPEVNCRQFNELEANAVASVVTLAVQGGVKSRDIAVVTPFRRQAAAIRRAIQRQLDCKATDLPIVDTVERVQGLTVELVVVSFCVTDPDYAADVASFLFSANRFNVAVSRARTRVVVFASTGLFKSIPAGYTDLLARERFRSCLLQIPAPLVMPDAG